jgi:glutathione S-transferase
VQFLCRERYPFPLLRFDLCHKNDLYTGTDAPTLDAAAPVRKLVSRFTPSKSVRLDLDDFLVANSIQQSQYHSRILLLRELLVVLLRKQSSCLDKQLSCGDESWGGSRESARVRQRISPYPDLWRTDDVISLFYDIGYRIFGILGLFTSHSDHHTHDSSNMILPCRHVCLTLLLLVIVVGTEWHVRAFSQEVASTSSPTMSAVSVPKRTLYDVPVSNNGARCRIIVYKKNIEHMIQIMPPISIGGLRSEAYLKRNPQGKMPMLIFEDDERIKGNHDNDDVDDDGDVYIDGNLNIAESDTVARFLLREYADFGPSFLPYNPRSNLIARFHDMYLTTIQGCLYKAAPPFGVFGSRKDAIAEFCRQLHILDELVLVGKCEIHKDSLTKAMYMCGSKVSLADATVFPTIVFAAYMLPKFGVNPPLPPKIATWFENLKAHDDDFKRVYDEIMGGLATWESNHRWDHLLGAGWRDLEPATLFDKIVAGDIPVEVVEQPDDKVLCFKDINPVAPAHVLVIPKDRDGLTRLGKATAEHTDILGRLMVRPSLMHPW